MSATMGRWLIGRFLLNDFSCSLALLLVCYTLVLFTFAWKISRRIVLLLMTVFEINFNKRYNGRKKLPILRSLNEFQLPTERFFRENYHENTTKTRMHSSRMRIVRCSGCLAEWWGGGGVGSGSAWQVGVSA